MATNHKKTHEEITSDLKFYDPMDTVGIAKYLFSLKEAEINGYLDWLTDNVLINILGVTSLYDMRNEEPYYTIVDLLDKKLWRDWESTID